MFDKHFFLSGARQCPRQQCRSSRGFTTRICPWPRLLELNQWVNRCPGKWLSVNLRPVPVGQHLGKELGANDRRGAHCIRDQQYKWRGMDRSASRDGRTAAYGRRQRYITKAFAIYPQPVPEWIIRFALDHGRVSQSIDGAVNKRESYAPCNGTDGPNFFAIE